MSFIICKTNACESLKLFRRGVSLYIQQFYRNHPVYRSIIYRYLARDFHAWKGEYLKNQSIKTGFLIVIPLVLLLNDGPSARTDIILELDMARKQAAIRSGNFKLIVGKAGAKPLNGVYAPLTGNVLY